MRKFLSAILLTVAVLSLTGCVNGRLDPRVPAGMKAAGSACVLVPDTAHAGSVPGQAICSVVANILGEVFGLFTATPGTVLPSKAAPLEGVVFRGVTIAVWPGPQAQRLRQRLDTDAVYAARVAAAMDAESTK